ncbi:prolyl aminopeptidase [Metamycoplasma hyosynoviae]|uniref:prolyl aminopeptidase n=1 Tax=Metamycoplasma hyosynoviae TaxID=29559 RepID=UPI002361B046|nr:prolyl aminopeptidase [Metamycoplasma hyosynoviae]MDD1359058.1 prolyl aminopeptidase [Metamycoplasma hyosynoviae]
MNNFYENTLPYNEGFLEVSKLHKVYFQELGNKNGVPILFVHGGPGGSPSSDSSRFFDPDHYRIIIFHQRGCGKSLPSSEIRENTTMDLVSDIEKLREHLKIDSWILFGGSWGSTLSLVYAINYSKRVKAMILRGIFLGRKEDQTFLYQEGSSYFFPDAYEEFANFVPADERKDLIKAYSKYLNSKNNKIAEQAAYHWAKWELGLITLYPIDILEEILLDKKANLELARLENHYFVNDLFLEDDNYILNNISKIKNIKTSIIHGRYDMDCRPESAYLLHKSLSNSTLHFVPAAGHSSKELGIAQALLDACEKFKSIK